MQPKLQRLFGALGPAGLVLSLAASALVASPLIASPLASGSPAATEPDPTTPAGFQGPWRGIIELPGIELEVLVRLAEEDGAWSGTIDIPLQNARDVALRDIRIDGPDIRFGLSIGQGDPTFVGSLKDEVISGSFTQGPGEYPFRLEPARNEGKALADREEDLTVDRGDLRLVGTLTVPEGPGPFPTAVLLSGSGSQDRDGTVFGLRPMADLADALSRAGFATLRADDRGVGGSGGEPGGAPLDELADDALAWVARLAEDPRIDGAAIGLIGHSQGGVVAPLAAARSEAVAFVVSLAGPAVPGNELILRQSRLLAAAAGRDDASLDAVQAILAEMLDTVRGDAAAAEIEPVLLDLARRQVAALPVAERQAPGLDEDGLQAQVRGMLSPVYRSFARTDPGTALRKVRVPVLALYGDLDLQVEAEQNLPAAGRALFEAGNQDVTLRTFPGLNHLFQRAETGAMEEYVRLKGTFAPRVLDALTAWLGDRFPPPESRRPPEEGTP